MYQTLDHRRGTALFITLVIAVGLVALVVAGGAQAAGDAAAGPNCADRR